MQCYTIECCLSCKHSIVLRGVDRCLLLNNAHSKRFIMSINKVSDVIDHTLQQGIFVE